MSRYVRERLRVDVAHLVLRTNLEASAASHVHLSRLREVLVDTVLSRWLPPHAVCATGAFVDVEDHRFDPSQGEVAVIDRSLVPPALAPADGRDGLFPIDAVLARIDLRHELSRATLVDALRSADAVHALRSGIDAGGGPLLPSTTLFAFGTDLAEGPPDAELVRMLDVAREIGLHHGGHTPALASPITALCVLGRGFWLHGRAGSDERSHWFRSRATTGGHDEMLTWVEALVNSCERLRCRREGRAPETSLEGTIGAYLASADSFDPIEVGLVARTTD